MKYFLLLLLIVSPAGSVRAQQNTFELQNKLPKELEEISGITRDGDFLWAIADDKGNPVYKLNLSGKIIQKIRVTNFPLHDVEAVAVDKKYLYIGDTGDNMGKRQKRMIVRILKSSIGKGRNVSVKGEAIHFTFPDHGYVKKQKSNNYDCEAIVSYKDSIYLFSKRRDDLETTLYALPKAPGTFAARKISEFKTKGLITDADFNEDASELALVGYDEGHTRPFIWILANFAGDDFFSGNYRRYELTNEKDLDWQIEGISYNDNDRLFLACEKTKAVPSILYLINKTELLNSKKGDSR